MVTTQKLMMMLTGQESIDSWMAEMVSSFPDFAEDHQRFLEVIEYLKIHLGEEATPSVDDLIGAIKRQIVSNWLFSSYLGFQANLDHFINPVARTFMDVDPEIYLREAVAKALPEYNKAQAVIDNFCRQLSPKLKEVYEGVIAYTSHLETMVPKMAHYNGYMLGNELLLRIIPGYQPDAQLTVRYGAALEDYFQPRLLTTNPTVGKD